MNFRTEINLERIDKPRKFIDYSSQILLLGSCFVENIGEKLNHHKFKTLINPYGIIFHPLAIEKSLQDIVNQKVYEKKDLVFDQGLWHSPHHHSDFSHPNLQTVLENINQNVKKSHDFLKKTSHVLITLGTSWVYHHIETDQLVANCHKIPQKQFVKRLLSAQEIANSLRQIKDILLEINPDMQLIWTVSPVRHLKDGFHENTLSKAHLFSALHEITDTSDDFYFPSYEILIDDLRDYRFYAEDLLHPNETAVTYIWEIFEKVWMSNSTREIIKQVAQIQKDLQHRPFFPESEKHKKFLENLHEKMHQLEIQHGISFSKNND